MLSKYHNLINFNRILYNLLSYCFKVAIKWGYNYIVWRNQNGRCSICLSWQYMSFSMAEAIMRQRLKDRNIHDIKVHSRGTGSWNLGEPPHEGTQKFSTNTIFHLMA